MRQSNFITKCDRLLLQSASGITKCDRMLLQSASYVQSVTDFITKCVRYYKVRHNNHCHSGKRNHQIVLKGLVAIFLQPPWLAENKENCDLQGLQMHTQSPDVSIKSDRQTGDSSNVALNQTIKLARKKSIRTTGRCAPILGQVNLQHMGERERF